MSIFNDHINLVNIKKSIDDILVDALNNPIKIKYAIITKSFDKKIVLKYFPDIEFKYIEEIDKFYMKYFKYKTKYITLQKQLGGTNINNMKYYYEEINKFLSDKNICDFNDIVVSDLIILSEQNGITKGYGGAYLLSGNINLIDSVFKLFKIFEKGKPDKNINEIGLTHYISDYFLNHINRKISDNFITFYNSKRCVNFFLDNHYIKKYKQYIIETIDIKDDDITTKDINIMIVEKVNGDLGGFLKSFLIKKKSGSLIEIDEAKSIEPQVIEMFDSIFFQIIYTLFIFNKEFNGFIHNDFHLGNILVKKDELLTKKFKIQRILDDEDVEDITEYNIEVKTFGITPKIWDFATSYLGSVNSMIKDNNIEFIKKYFDYKNFNDLIKYDEQSLILNKDLTFLLNSIELLGLKYYLPNDYIIEIKKIFSSNNIIKIFNQFIERMDSKYKNDLITLNNCDFWFFDK